ncbi:MAG: spondin domain-containing protein [Gaiellaceae bacterium]
MPSQMKPALLLALAAVIVIPSAAAAPRSQADTQATAGAKSFTFQITIRNLGRADLTSPVYAVHNKSARLFRVGKKASPGLGALAEDGVTSQLLAEARRKRGVGQADVGPRIAPRKSASFRVTTTSKHLRLSWGSMQVCSNDTFVGQSAARLPARKVGARKVIRLRALDAGTEQNTESANDVPCLGAHNVGPSESKVVRRSPGIKGIADLNNASQGWGRFLARVIIKRVA